MSTETGPAPGAPPDLEVPWRRLDRRLLVVGPLSSLVRLLPLMAVLLLTGGAQGGQMRLWIAVGTAAAVVLAGVLRWRTTRYRITADRVELHTGWLRRQRRSVPLDRIRTVDLTATLLHRACGLSEVRVSAAATATPAMGGGLHLNAVSKAEAEKLRRQLLDRSPLPAGRPTGSGGRPDVPAATELARLDWSWLRFAPLTFSALAGIGAVAGVVFNLVGELGVDPREIDAVGDAAGTLRSAPVWAGVAVIGLIVLAMAVVGALLMFAERWYGFRLTREPDGTLRVRRGLLTRRSLSVAEQRLRGAEVVEPLLLRAGRGARTRAVSTGLAGEPSGGELLPPAPRAAAHRVASATLRVPATEITLAPLRRHPRAALTRRMVRAVGPVAVPAGVAFAVGGPLGVSWLGPLAAALLVPAALLGRDRYRNLGHQLTDGHLVTRSGSIVRKTVALRRTGVIGWTFRQTIFQRRSGLVSVEAVTAAGVGGYTVTDVAAADAVALADVPAFRAGTRVTVGAELPTHDRVVRPDRADNP